MTNRKCFQGRIGAAGRDSSSSIVVASCGHTLRRLLVGKYCDHLPLYRQSGNLCARRHRARADHHGDVGGQSNGAGLAAGRSSCRARHGRREAACGRYAGARSRYFYDIHVTTNAPIAGEALQRIGQLFDVERTAMGLPPEQRQRVRQSAARPIIDDLAAFLDASLAMISGRSELAKAIRYACSRWTALTRTRYLDDGTLEISNNAAVRRIRCRRRARCRSLYRLSKPPSSTASILKPICAR